MRTLLPVSPDHEHGRSVPPCVVFLCSWGLEVEGTAGAHLYTCTTAIDSANSGTHLFGVILMQLQWNQGQQLG